MASLTKELKARLWQWYGAPEHPAEWDGRVYGGGKISQRFWEYFIAIDMMDLQSDSIVLDIGGGSPATGLTIFPRLLASAGVKVIALDVNFAGIASGDVENVVLEVGLADHAFLSDALRRHAPTHMSCVSVLEHASYEQQRGIFDAIETAFTGERAVFTFEFHETECYVEQQVTTVTLSNAVSGLQRYYLDRIEKAPLHCVNAVKGPERLWYPMALRFDRVEERKAAKARRRKTGD